MYRRPDARAMRFFTIDPLNLEPSVESKDSSFPKDPDMLLPKVNLLVGQCDVRALLEKVCLRPRLRISTPNTS